MKTTLAVAAVLLCSGAAGAQQVKPLIDRPLTLDKGGLDLTLHGTYTNWSTGSLTGAGTGSIDGESLTLGIDYGATDKAQVGLALAFPINPGAGFGSVLGNATYAVSPSAAVRVDAGFENAGANGNFSDHTSRYFGGLGARIVVPISPTLAFVSGRSGAVQFGHFNNIGDSGTGLYTGATLLPDGSSDFFVFSTGDGVRVFAFNLPAGLMFQVDPRLALTLFAGYSGVVRSPDGASADLLHFIPVGVEGVVSPTAPVDIGVRFYLDGYVGRSGSGSLNGPGYFDTRALMLWFRFRA